ncbi:MAG: hypothetical protein JSR59_07265 [Proteobacteria bacterium]|nr:hypothetical protein [Pseudomonadota bacterium]
MRDVTTRLSGTPGIKRDGTALGGAGCTVSGGSSTTDTRAARSPDGPAEPEPDDGHRWASRISWALLLKRVFEIDMQHCPNCGGELKIIATILDPAVIERILDHLGLPARPPPRSPAREPIPQAA